MAGSPLEMRVKSLHVASIAVSRSVCARVCLCKTLFLVSTQSLCVCVCACVCLSVCLSLFLCEMQGDASTIMAKGPHHGRGCPYFLWSNTAGDRTFPSRCLLDRAQSLDQPHALYPPILIIFKKLISWKLIWVGVGCFRCSNNSSESR
jgi:hypothetical protein